MIRILSGMRPSGKLHLGNYLGAAKNWIELQNNPDLELAVYMIADYHGITTPFDPKTYDQGVIDQACQYLAAGLDPQKVLLIRQSKIPQHTELAWLFNTITPVSWLERLPTYKEKIEQTHGKYTHMGILDYPVLMAADILIYKANTVPVGDDQKAHIDITNEIAKKFNSMFGETFAPVKALMTGGARIKSLQDPAKKMSKSGDEGVALIDSPEVIREKIKKAVTDSGKEVLFDEEKKPAISNLMNIYALLAPDIKNLRQVEKMYEGKSYVEFKNDLAEVIINFLKPFQEKYGELKNNLDQVETVLTKSEEKARVIASSTLTEVKEKMGF